ncbi:MAG: SDR family NAD(P)-dependent oxidoreductase [Bacteroidaceae bacterium]|nr:SDR family NAD(P)-dependent oxidoreductase [Bacteroidaceae bacterium]MBP5323212.1 SDR family NAD(P)-dependent oxidoreductase [Bacteroidaceae bacterium]
MKAIIIGATSGLGRGVAEALAAQGDTVGVAGRRIEMLQSIAQQYVEGQVVTQAMDVTSVEACTALDSLLQRLGAPDLLVYVAGIGFQNTQLDSEKELATVRTNCEGMVRVITHFVRYAVSCGAYHKGHKAHIAVVTSVATTAAMGAAPAYSASKRMESTYVTALVQLAHMQHWPLRFTDIRPGFVSTALLNPDKRYPLLMTTDQAVKHIMRGIRRRRRVVVFDIRYKIIVFFWKLVPRAIWERMTFVNN